MTAVKAGDVDGAVALRGPDVNMLLFYGPDTGRIAERARAAAHAAVDDPADAFQLIRLDGDVLADQPGRLVEEATTFGLFGNRRAIWIRPTSRMIAPAITACLDIPLVDTVVVVEAGDLQKSSPLRVACERSPRALSLPSYADDDRDLGSVITETLRARGFAVEADARTLLVDSLGGDRLATRGELEKLALYCHGRHTIGVADVEAVVSDVSGASFDAAIDAAFLGDLAEVEGALQHLARLGAAPSALLALALRHAIGLLAHRDRLDTGGTTDSVVRSWRGLHFKRQPVVGRQLRTWNPERLSIALGRLQTAILETRRSPAFADAISAQVLFAIARTARAA